MLGQRRVDLDHIEGSPVGLHPLARPAPAGQPDGPDGLHVADPAHRPGTGTLHRGEHLFAALLVDVALDQGARVEIEHQRSSSRSARTIAEAERPVRSGLGGRLGSGREAGGTLRSATSSRRRSSPRRTPAGTMSATGRPRGLTLIFSPASTWCRTLLRLVFSSLTPISRM